MMKLASYLAAAAFAATGTAHAQSAVNMNALRGLAPVAVLGNGPAGRAALAANLAITAAIQNGSARQPLLQPFTAQQQQALRDAFITAGNGDELADGLGSTLGGAYQALATYSSPDDGKTASFTDISPAVAELLAYTSALTGADANAGKFFFADETQKNGKTPAVPASPAAKAILAAEGGVPDVFGIAYNHKAGTPGADPDGNSRPFQTEPGYLHFTGPDYFGVASGNTAYLLGPAQNLTASPAFPSGHTTYGFTESLLFAIMIPERFQQMIVRGAEYGNDRIILGAHYAMDVLAGRTLAYWDLAHLLANDPAYVAQKEVKAQPIANYTAALAAARHDLRQALAAKCGAGIAACAAQDSGRFAKLATNQAFYESTQTYGLPVVYAAMAGKTEDVAKLAPEAGNLLRAGFPKLTLTQADQILTTTEGPGGGFLDNGLAFGVYSRLDLYKAAALAAQR